MANSNADAVWIQICYFVEFQKNDEGFWTRKFVGDDEENMTAILVPKSILYGELYEKVIEKLKIDSMLYELEMRCESPIPSIYPELPMKIDCDNLVRWLISFFDRTKLNITLKKKVAEIQEPYLVKSEVAEIQEPYLMKSGTSVEWLEETKNVVIDDNGRDAYGIGGESLESNEHDHNVVIDDYNADTSDDGNFGKDARENTPIRDTLGGNNNGLNSHEGPIVKSIGSLDSMSSHPDSRHVSSVRIPVSLDITENDLFASKDHLIHKLEMMALKCHFEFIPQKSTRSIYVAHCAVKQCGWRVRATKLNMSVPESSSPSATKDNTSEIFQVRIYEGNHSCSLSVRQKNHRHASYKFVGRHYLDKFRDVNHVYKPKDITSDFYKDFGYTISYDKAYDAKKFAIELIHGDAKESYGKSPEHCHMLEAQNPDTKTFIRTDKEKRFKYR